MKTTTHLEFTYTSPTMTLMVRAISFTERAEGAPDMHRVRIIQDERDYFLTFTSQADAKVEADNVAKDFTNLMLNDLYTRF